MAWYLNIDWEQYRRNLELERSEWNKFEEQKKNLEEQLHSKTVIAEYGKRKAVEKAKAEFSRKVKWAHRAYIRNVEKKFKPSISVSD